MTSIRDARRAGLTVLYVDLTVVYVDLTVLYAADVDRGRAARRTRERA